MNNISVLIADSDAELIEALSAYIKTKNGLTLAAAASNGEEAYKLILETNPDVVILDPILPLLDGIGVLDKLKNNRSVKTPKVILYSVSSQFLNIASDLNSEIDYCLLKPQSCEHVCEIIDMVVSSKTKKAALEEMTTDLLRAFGFPANLKGYYYCRSAIIMVVENVELQAYITKLLYPQIAKVHNTTAARVERAIRHAIEVAWKRGDPNIKNKYFIPECMGEGGKPTNSEFIATMADRIRLEIKAVK